MKLYNIFWTDCYGNSNFLATTNNLDKWLEDNNKERDEEEAESLDDFEIEEANTYIYEEENNSKSTKIKTFEDYSMVTFDRTDVNMRGIRYTTTEYFWCQIIEEDMPKIKELLGDRLYEWALDGGKTIEIPEDEVWGEK